MTPNEQIGKHLLDFGKIAVAGVVLGIIFNKGEKERVIIIIILAVLAVVFLGVGLWIGTKDERKDDKVEK